MSFFTQNARWSSVTAWAKRILWYVTLGWNRYLGVSATMFLFSSRIFLLRILNSPTSISSVWCRDTGMAWTAMGTLIPFDTVQCLLRAIS